MRRGAVIGFGVEAFALFHTEPVLLVDYHQGQVRGLEGLGKRRVRGHDNARLTTGSRSERLTPGGKLHTTGQQGDGNFRRHLGRRDRRSTGRAHRALKRSAAASVSLAPGCARVSPDTILLMVS
mgnify:CR=1 FL=1